jgi:hypothetical protein
VVSEESGSTPQRNRFLFSGIDNRIGPHCGTVSYFSTIMGSEGQTLFILATTLFIADPTDGLSLIYGLKTYYEVVCEFHGKFWQPAQ